MTTQEQLEIAIFHAANSKTIKCSFCGGDGVAVCVAHEMIADIEHPMGLYCAICNNHSENKIIGRKCFHCDGEGYINVC